MDNPGPSWSSDKDRMEAAMSALNMIAQGKRNMVCGEIPTAVNQFQEACKVLSKSYGETAKECAEAYYQYGRALLDLARMETGVLGNALQGVPEEEDGEKSADEQFEKGDMEVEDRYRLRAEVVDAMSEKELASAEKEKEQKDKEKDGEKKDESNVEKEVEKNKEKDELKDEQKDEKKNEEKDKEDETKDKEVKDETKDKVKDEEKDKELKDEKKNEKDEEECKKIDEEKDKDEESMDTDVVVNETKEVLSVEDKQNDAKDETKLNEKKENKEKDETEIDKKEEKMDEDRKLKDEDQETKEKKPEGESSSTKNSTEDEEEEGTEEEGTEEDEDESEAVDTAEEGDNSQEEGSQGEKEGEENADDVSNLQLAWEMLELAKVIYLKDEDKEAKLKASDAYLKLGEVSLETEQYAQSISDFTECLNIQKSVLDPDDRSLAETYYQLGLAYSFNKEYDESIDSFRAAVKVMESKIDSLQKRLDDDKFPPPKEGSFDDPKKLAEQEINDLKEILPDIRGKVEEVIEERRQIEELKKMAKEGMSVITESLGLQKPEEKSKDEPKKPVSDISHLIRRKRKPDEEEEPVEPKKSRQENGSGDAPPKVNGVNGDKESMDVDDKKADSEAPKPTEAVAS
ncbi:protein HGV2-like isoform X1 [Ylistrum balloti]|uniref:protein HGV2-like isoform X1 n=1 Tax=Ylistrum balloti TaxID=509963 RepID=UPI002905E572|nr:protein HGV2-like isoform X1 [Ylistrum balloti]